MKNLMSLYGSNESTIINVYTIYINKKLYCIVFIHSENYI